MSWELARPAGMWALALPVLLWILARFRREPPSVATGTLAYWKRILAADPVPTAHATRKLTPAARWMIAALFTAAFALVGPRPVKERLPNTWTVVVDHSPSTSLALGSSGARLDAALAGALRSLSARAASEDRVRWLSSARAPLELSTGERPAEDWLEHPAWFAPAPRWRLHDHAGALWVTDTAEGLTPDEASVFASGGPAVHGPVSVSGSDRLDWTPGGLLNVDDGAPPRTIAFVPRAESIPEPVRAIARIWARERRFLIDAQADDGAALVLERPTPEPAATSEITVRAGRDGWFLSGTAPARGLLPLHTHAPQENWLVAGSANEKGGAGGAGVLVHASSGRVRIAWSEVGDPEGDPALFALSWSRLFEAWALPAAGVVPLEEREAAGDAVEREGADPLPAFAQPEGERAFALDAILAAAAALLALVALSVRS